MRFTSALCSVLEFSIEVLDELMNRVIGCLQYRAHGSVPIGGFVFHGAYEHRDIGGFT